MAINFALNPTIDVAKFNAIVATMKAGFTNFTPIDGTKLQKTLDSVKPSIVGLVQGSDSLASGLGKADEAAKKLGNSGSLANKAFNFSNMVNAVNIVSSAFGQVAQAGIDYESNLAAVSAITGFTGDNLNVLGASARSLAKEFGGSANDQLKSFQGILSKLGPQVAEDSGALALLAKNVNILSAASGDDAATSMNAITDAMLQMGLASGTPMEQAQNSTKVINALAAGAQVGAAEIPQVAQSLLAAGVAAKGANMSLIDVNAAIQVLAVGGKTGAEAGTALRNVLGLMQKASAPAEAAMARLGTSSKELGNLLTTQGLDVALAKLSAGMTKVGTDAERNALMMEIFGAENSAAAGIMMQNSDKFAEFSAGIKKGMEGQGSAFEQAGIRMNTASVMISRIQAYISDAFIGVSQSVGQGVTALVGASAQFAPLIMSFSGLSQALPDGMFNNIINSAKSFGGVILNTVVPGLATQDIATKSIVLNTEALTIANIQNAVAAKAKLALDYLQSTAIYGLVSGQLSLNAAMAANPIGIAIAGAVALGGALYLLYDNVESVRNVFDGAWSLVKAGASGAWEIIKAGGSVLAEVGSMVYSVISLPFQYAWAVVKGVGSAIGSIIGSMLGVSDTGVLIQSAFSAITGIVNSVIGAFNNVKAVISGITATISSLTTTVTTGIGQLFSLDFGGLWDTISGAGAKASESFNSAFNDKMRTAKFNDAKKAIEKGLENAGSIEAKLKVKTDFSETVRQYEKTQNEIADLEATKKGVGILNDTDAKRLDNLKESAIKMNNEIAKVAPNAVVGMKDLVAKNGELITTYDININRAKEFAIASDTTDAINRQKTIVSKAVNDMSASYAQQATAADALKKKLLDPNLKGEDVDKLKTSFADASKKAEEMKTAMVDNFLKAGQAGMLTDTAIQGVAKSLKMSNEDAKKMLITEELKKAANQSKLTDTQVAELAQRYNTTGNEVTRIFNEQKKVTAEIENSKKATEGWSDAAKRIKEADAATDTAIRNAKLQLRNNKDLTEAEKERLRVVISSGEETKKNLRDQAQNLVAVDKEMKTNAKYAEVVTEYKAKEAKATQSVYEKEKSRYDEAKKTHDLEVKANELKLSAERIAKGITVTERTKNEDKIKSNAVELAFAKTQLEALDKRKELIDTITDKDTKAQAEKRDTAKKDILDTKKSIENQIADINNSTASVKATISIDDKKLQSEIAQIESDSKRIQLEADVKLGKVSQVTLDIFDLNALRSDKQKMIDEIADLQSKISTNKDSNIDTSALEKEIEAKKQLVLKSDIEINTKTLELDDRQARERIGNIANSLDRERALKLYELQQTYDGEVQLAKGNTAKLLAIQLAFSDNRNKIEQDYLLNTSLAYNSLTKLSTALMNIKPSGNIDKSALDSATKARESLAKQKKDLQDSYNSGKTDFDSYQKSLTDIQQQEADNRNDIAKAESDKQKQIWKGFKDAFGGYFNTMYDEYSKKALDSMNAVSQANIAASEISKQKTASESEFKKAQLDNDYFAMVASSAKRAALEQEESNNKAKTTKAVGDMYANLGISASAMFAQVATESGRLDKALLLSSLATVKALVPIFAVKITGEELSKLGPIGLLTAAGLMATMYGLVGIAESAVAGAFKGGVVNFQGRGSGTSDSNIVKISHGESVLTAKATSDKTNQKFFNYANKTGGNVLDFINFDQNTQKELSEKKVAQSYSSALKSQKILKKVVETQKLESLRIKYQNDNITKELQDLKNKFVRANRMLLESNTKMSADITGAIANKTLVETHNAVSVKATNNIINEVSRADLFGVK